MRTHKIGTITFGLLLVTFGILFLLRIFITSLSFDIIFKLWPIIFVLLGLEVLFGNFKHTEDKLIYDKTAFGLIIILSFFAMSMAIAELCITHASYNIVW